MAGLETIVLKMEIFFVHVCPLLLEISFFQGSVFSYRIISDSYSDNDLYI